MYYIYRHVRPDKNVPFYIGRGLIYHRTVFPRRAFDVKRRNKIWCGIVRRNGGNFEVEFMFWSESRDTILQKEQEFISLYGRISNGTGTLSNLTDGGDGALGLRHTEETKEKLRKRHKENPCRRLMFQSKEFISDRIRKVSSYPGTMLGKKHSAHARELMGSHPNRRGSRHWYAKKLIDIETGEVFGCIADAANARGIKKDTLDKYLQGRFKNKTTLRPI